MEHKDNPLVITHTLQPNIVESYEWMFCLSANQMFFLEVTQFFFHEESEQFCICCFTILQLPKLRETFLMLCGKICLNVFFFSCHRSVNGAIGGRKTLLDFTFMGSYKMITAEEHIL